MVTINGARVVDARVDRVWEVVSDIDRDVDYWNGLSSIRNLRKDGNVIEREVTVGFIGQTSSQRIELKPKELVELKMTRGPLRGSKDIRLTSLGDNKTRVDVSWNFEFSGVPEFARPFVRSQLERGTKEALAKIAQVAEGERTQSPAAPANGRKRRLQ
jgi:ribosome-associated toxin RatA of RatAB toxin-antitoxin module